MVGGSLVAAFLVAAILVPSLMAGVLVVSEVSSLVAAILVPSLVAGVLVVAGGAGGALPGGWCPRGVLVVSVVSVVSMVSSLVAGGVPPGILDRILQPGTPGGYARHSSVRRRSRV